MQMKILKRNEKKHKDFLEKKRETGLTDEERIHPLDSKALETGDYITHVEVLKKISKLDENGEEYTEYHHHVTYIDGSSKDFIINVKLSSIFPSTEMENQMVAYQKIKKL